MKYQKIKLISLSRRDSGAVILETAVVTAMFFLFLIIGIDLIRISHAAIALQFVATRALREATVGPQYDPSGNVINDTLSDPIVANQCTTPSNGDSANGQHFACMVRTHAKRFAQGFHLDLDNTEILICNGTLAANGMCTTDDVGNPWEPITIRIQKPLGAFSFANSSVAALIFRNYTLNAVAIGRNERFDYP